MYIKHYIHSTKPLPVPPPHSIGYIAATYVAAAAALVAWCVCLYMLMLALTY